MLNTHTDRAGIVAATLAALLVAVAAPAAIADTFWDLADEDYGSDPGKVGSVKYTGGLFDSPSTFSGFWSQAGHEVLFPDYSEITALDFAAGTGQLHSRDGFALPDMFRAEFRLNYVREGSEGTLSLKTLGSAADPGPEIDLTWFGTPVFARLTEVSTGAFDDPGVFAHGSFHTYTLEVRTDLPDGSDYARLWIDDPGMAAAPTLELIGTFSNTSPVGLHNLQFVVPGGNSVPIILQLDYFRLATIPEPATSALLALGSLAILRRRRHA